MTSRISLLLAMLTLTAPAAVARPGHHLRAPHAPRLCQKVADGRTPQRLEGSEAQVTAACAALETAYADAATAAKPAVEAARQAVEDARATAKAACEADRDACRAARQEARTAIRAARQSLRDAAKAYRTAVHAARQAFRAAIAELAGAPDA